ncbi:MAG: hypothetical protein J3K34DRAFT_400355 [Monoraphidium minutum]|nr:MAG: hypothetical protein J3K34DRAFT_400355 [Monoraphidium minutum]
MWHDPFGRLRFILFVTLLCLLHRRPAGPPPCEASISLSIPLSLLATLCTCPPAAQSTPPRHHTWHRPIATQRGPCSLQAVGQG